MVTKETAKISAGSIAYRILAQLWDHFISFLFFTNGMLDEFAQNLEYECCEHNPASLCGELTVPSHFKE